MHTTYARDSGDFLSFLQTTFKLNAISYFYSVMATFVLIYLTEDKRNIRRIGSAIILLSLVIQFVIANPAGYLLVKF